MFADEKLLLLAYYSTSTYRALYFVGSRSRLAWIRDFPHYIADKIRPSSMNSESVRKKPVTLFTVFIQFFPNAGT